jgi:hypothetical protein
VTDEQRDAEPGTIDPLAARLDRPLTELTVDELMALKDELAKRGVKVYNSVAVALAVVSEALRRPAALPSR